MAAPIEDPFDPEHFGDVFGKALAKLADDRKIECVTSPNHLWQGTVVMNGTIYEISIEPMGTV
jgi:hypothetical protein